MTIYIALLRGINVSGHNKIKMAELKGTLETMRLHRVQTYIQSGNVLFESEESPETLCPRIEEEIRAAAEGESIHVSVLTEAPPQKAVDLLSASERDNDEYHIDGREIYFLFRQSILDSKLAKHLNKLGDTVTTRNWNTMNKLAALAKAMQA